MVAIRYGGRTYTGRIKSAKLVGRELFVTVESDGFKTPKCLHHTHVTIVPHVHQIAKVA